jgi:hypothetical protein
MILNPVSQKAYKLVRVIGNKRFSFLNTFLKMPKYRVEYLPDKLVYPTIGKLFVFCDICSALNHLNETIVENDVELWEVITYGNALQEKVFRLWANDDSCVADFWQNMDAFDFTHCNPMPKGSYVCEALQLFKQIPLTISQDTASIRA